jgi:hypothetical protein
MLDGNTRCSCGSGCPTYGACLRRKGIHIMDPGQRHITSDWDAHLDRYAWAVRNGIQPASTLREETEQAIAVSEATGEPFRADV